MIRTSETSALTFEVSQVKDFARPQYSISLMDDCDNTSYSNCQCLPDGSFRNQRYDLACYLLVPDRLPPTFLAVW